MKFTIDEQVIGLILQTLHEKDLGSKTLAGIRELLTKNPIKDEKEEPKA